MAELMDKKELSEMYKIGYKTGFKCAIIYLMKHTDDEHLINEMKSEYKSQPWIKDMEDM